jgi:hypothetical protein
MRGKDALARKIAVFQNFAGFVGPTGRVCGTAHNSGLPKSSKKAVLDRFLTTFCNFFSQECQKLSKFCDYQVFDAKIFFDVEKSAAASRYPECSYSCVEVQY